MSLDENMSGSEEEDLSDDFDVEDDEDLSDDFDADDGEASDGDSPSESEVTIPHPAGVKRRHSDSDENEAIKKAKTSQAKVQKTPTADQLSQLKETENLFQSNIFRMQISELLSEVLVKEKKTRLISAFVDKLKNWLLKLSPGDSHKLCDQKWLKKKKVKVPFVQQPLATKGVFQFSPPKAVHIVGSYALKACIKRGLHVDLALEIPKSVFEDKDHLNQRYSRKRALYLAVVASALQTSDLVSEVKVTYHHGNTLQPILMLTPSEEHGKGYIIRLHTTPEEGSLRLARFQPSKNNLRTQWYKEEAAEDTESEDKEPPTPHYNSSVLADVRMLDQHGEAEHHLVDAQGVREGIILLKVWLHQRQLDVGVGCINGFIITMYVVYLMCRRKLNALMSSYQVLRNTLIHLATSDWTTEGISIEQSMGSEDLRELHTVFPVVFMDSSGLLNLCANVSTAVYHTLRHEAKLALEFLEAPGLDGFEMLFMTSINFTRTFDQTLHIKPEDNLSACVEHQNLHSAVMDHNGDIPGACLPSLLQLLNKAIGHRVKLIGIKPQPVQQWDVTSLPPVSVLGDVLTLGLLLDADHGSSAVDKGPPADTPQAAEFQKFWGEPCELRRFQDGSICEAVVWKCRSLADRRAVIGKIIKHILQRHAGIPHNSVIFLSSQLDSLLRLPCPRKRKEGQTSPMLGTGEEEHTSVSKVLEELGKQIRGLEGLPLAITRVQGIHPVFRCAEVFPALPAKPPSEGCKRSGKLLYPRAEGPCPSYTPALNVLCMLEGSGKWPEDLEAVRRIKAAFYIQLGQTLERVIGCLTSIHTDHVDVFKEGYVFRLTLGYLHEIKLAKMTVTPEGMTSMKDNDTSRSLERCLVAMPKLASTLNGLQLQHSSLGACVRLAKRWTAAHMCLAPELVPEEAIELVCAYLYLQPAPCTPPWTPLVGFLRFLHLLSTHDWSTEPLCVNLNHEFTKEDYAEVHAHFSQARSELPIMYLATPTHKLTSLWTINAPTAPVLKRVAQLARVSLNTLEDQLAKTNTGQDFKLIFRAPLEVYDVVIHLRGSMLARPEQAVDARAESDAHQKPPNNDFMPVTEFDPVQLYIAELREAYGDMGLFFHDCYGGSLIGVIWKPGVQETKPFKVSGMTCSKVDASSGNSDPHLTFNMPAVLEDFKVLGQGLVSLIETRT